MTTRDEQITLFMISAHQGVKHYFSDSVYEDLRDELAMILFATDPEAPSLDLADDDDFDYFMNDTDYYAEATAILTAEGITL